MSEIEDLRARIAALEEAAKPKPAFKAEPMPRFDPTAQMVMPENALRAMLDAQVPMADIVADNLRRNPGSVSAPTVRGSGWADEVPIRSRSAGELELIDRLTEKFVGGPNQVR